MDVSNFITPDEMATSVANQFQSWSNLKTQKLTDWEEVRKYVFATDTSTTTNSVLPWKNKTTTPKLCQIRDNLYANYMASLFPKRHWVEWQADNQDSANKDKKQAIESYMSNYVLAYKPNRLELGKLVLDYIDYGNCISTIEWIDERQNQKDAKQQIGYVGPKIVRISPLDIQFNPIAPSFQQTTKIVKTVMSMGELKKLTEQMSKTDESTDYAALFNYVVTLRQSVRSYTGVIQEKDNLFSTDGFTSFRAWMEQDECEILTAYGDFYDIYENKWYPNHTIMVVDRHKLISIKPNPSWFGFAPIFHAGWRVRQDNLWAMGPLENLVGLQYRIDHIENLKADVFDLIAFPTLKVKGIVDDFKWGPFERIHTDQDSDVEIMAPPFQVLQANSEIDRLTSLMEEMAGSPKEAMGFRTPGEKTAYEVQRLENAGARIYYSKIIQFEDTIVEPLLNGMLELAKRNMTEVDVPVFDDEFNFTVFNSLTPSDITGSGHVRPVAAKHFAEKAELVQNLTAFANSPLYADQAINVHFSGLQIANMIEDVIDLEKYQIISPFIRLSEQADGQRLANAHQEAVQSEAVTPAGIAESDTKQPFTSPQQGAVGGPQ